MKKQRTKLALGAALVAAAMILNACSSSNITRPASEAVTSLSGGISRALTSVSSGAPHVITTGTVTADYEFKPWQKVLQALLPRAMATAVGLSSVWDPSPGSPITGAHLSIGNLYMGGGIPCSGTPPICTFTKPDSTVVTFPQNVPVKTWIGQALDPNFQNSNGGYVTAFGRLHDALMITCAIAMLVPDKDTDGLPTVGTHNITFPADLTSDLYKDVSAGGCGFDTSDAGQGPVPAVVTAVSGTNFTKKIVITVDDENDIYLKLDLPKGIMNFMMLEDSAVSGGHNKVSRTIVKMSGMNNLSTVKTMYEFSSMAYPETRNTVTCWDGSNWTCDFEMHRVYINNATDEGYILSSQGNPGGDDGLIASSPTRYKQYSAAGKPVEIAACTSSSCAQSIALSVGLAGQYNADGSTPSLTSEYNGCVAIADRSLTSDNTLACDKPGTTIGVQSDSSSVSATVVNASRLFYGQEDGSHVPLTLLNTNENTDLSFTSGTDIYTAPTAQ